MSEQVTATSEPIGKCKVCSEDVYFHQAYDSVPKVHRHCHTARVADRAEARRKKDPRGEWWRRAVQRARFRSNSKGFMDFALEEDEPIDMPTFCPVLGVMMDYGDTPRCDDKPSIDQIIPWQGYKYGNVKVISHRANTIKSFGTADEHYKILRYMLRNGG